MDGSGWGQPIRGAALARTQPLARDLVACYVGNEGAGTHLHDYGGYGYHGTLTNSPNWVAGRNGWALELDGATTHVNCGDLDVIEGASALSISFWLYQDVMDQADRILYCEQDPTHRVNLLTTATGQLRWQIADGANTFGYIADYAPDPIAQQTWAHLCCVFDGDAGANADRMAIYVDGVRQTLAFAGTIPATTPALVGVDFTIGSGGQSLDGRIAGLMMWRRPLTAAEVRWLYREPYAVLARPSTVPALGAVSLEATGPTLFSLSGEATAWRDTTDQTRFRNATESIYYTARVSQSA